jgi:hypothetical protein
MPVAAQVFQVWWYALNEDKVSEDADIRVFRTAFPEIMQQIGMSKSAGFDARSRSTETTRSCSRILPLKTGDL